MDRILVIDQDRAAMQKLGLACLEQGIAVGMADNLCEGVRALVGDDISLILVDALELRLSPRDSATLLERVAPGVPVVVMARAGTDLARIVALELAGFRVIAKPVAVADVLAKVPVAAGDRRR